MYYCDFARQPAGKSAQMAVVTKKYGKKGVCHVGFEPVNSAEFGKNFDPSDGLEASSLENECQEDIPQPRRA